MYDTKFVCTYNTPEVFLDTDNITQEEKDFVREAIYRQELLNVFGIDDFDETELDKAMETAISELYIKVKDCDALKECILKLEDNFMITNKLLSLMLLYSYDYMYLTHICISEFLKNGKINENNILKLKEIIF
jgi:hypothetical protein